MLQTTLKALFQLLPAFEHLLYCLSFMRVFLHYDPDPAHLKHSAQSEADKKISTFLDSAVTLKGISRGATPGYLGI